MSKRFVIANDQIYDMYSLSNTDLRTKDGCLYRLDRCIGVIYEELDSIELKAKAFELVNNKIVIITWVSFTNSAREYNEKCLEETYRDRHPEVLLSEREFSIIKQALEIEK